MGKNKKVTFSSRVKVVTDSGSIHYERDWGSSPFDFFGQSENLDFVQEQFEQKLSMLGYTGNEDLERIQELTMPMFQCANNAVQKIGAVEYLKLLAKAPQQACGSPAPTTNKSGALSVAMLSDKNTRKAIKARTAKKRGVLRPKDIPGRDTPEQRKQRLMAGKMDATLVQKMSKLELGQTKSPQQSTVKPILKVNRNEYNDVVIIDLTSIDEATLYGTEGEEEDAREEYWSSEDNASEEERESPAEREDVASRIPTPTQESSDAPQRNPSSSRRDPPSFEEFVEHISFVEKPSRRASSSPKPDPSASYYQEETAEELSYTRFRLASNLRGRVTPTKSVAIQGFSCE